MLPQGANPQAQEPPQPTDVRGLVVLVSLIVFTIALPLAGAAFGAINGGWAALGGAALGVAVVAVTLAFGLSQ